MAQKTVLTHHPPGIGDVSLRKHAVVVVCELRAFPLVAFVPSLSCFANDRFFRREKSGKNGVFFCLARTAESNPSGSTSNLMFRTMGRPVEFTASRNLASDPEPQRSAQEVRRHNISSHYISAS